MFFPQVKSQPRNGHMEKWLFLVLLYTKFPIFLFFFLFKSSPLRPTSDSVETIRYDLLPAGAHFLITDARTIYCSQNDRSYGRIVLKLYWRSAFISYIFFLTSLDSVYKIEKLCIQKINCLRLFFLKIFLICRF